VKSRAGWLKTRCAASPMISGVRLMRMTLSPPTTLRIAAVAMIGLINIWMDAEIQIDFLPKPHVAVSQAKFG